MLGKLLKYDTKSMFRIFVPLWLALLAVSVVNHFTLRSSLDISAFGSISRIVSMILYVCLVMAVLVVTIALIILRFYNGLLKNEGYLMFTLPVRPWQLITSKCILATVVSLLSLIFGILSAVLIGAELGEVADFFKAIWEARGYITGNMVLFVILCIVLVISAVLAEITHIYACLALGHLANRHRIALAVLAYIVINTVLSMALTVFMNCYYRFHWNFMSVVAADQTLGATNVLLAAVIGVFLLQVVIFFIITERILSKRLNLE